MLIALTPGRVLRWAPHWPCSSDVVLFDASSGDYWVLSAEGRAVVEWLLLEPGIERDGLLARLRALTPDAATLIGNLGAAGLLVSLVDGQVARLPAAASILG